jgi:hypothetical protein
VSEAPSYEDIVHALRLRRAGAPQLQDRPARDIGHDLMANGYLPTEPGPALVRRALVEIKEEAGVVRGESTANPLTQSGGLSRVAKPGRWWCAYPRSARSAP